MKMVYMHFYRYYFDDYVYLFYVTYADNYYYLE